MRCPDCGERMNRTADGASHRCPACGTETARTVPRLQDLRAEALAEDARDRGLVCPRCGCRLFSVVYTRPMTGSTIQRRRQCRHCGKRITTAERAVGPGAARPAR